MEENIINYFRSKPRDTNNFKYMEEFIKNITREAGLAVLEKFKKVGIAYTKTNISDVVTEADLVSNKIIVEAIKTKYPEHGIISEEIPAEGIDREYVWIIDPLDGTRNFATKTPLFGVMVALTKNKVVQMSVIFDPVHDEFFFAKFGKGAFLNGERIHCSETKEWEHSFGCANASLSPNKVAYFNAIAAIAKDKSFWMSGFGSVATASTYVADARRDWYCSSGSKVWDYAPAALMMSEAGCVVTNFRGEPWTLSDTNIVSANKYLHPQLLKIAQESIK